MTIDRQLNAILIQSKRKALHELQIVQYYEKCARYDAQITQIVRFIEFGEENMAACKRCKCAYIAANKHLGTATDKKIRAQHEARIRAFNRDCQLIAEGIELGSRELARIRAERHQFEKSQQDRANLVRAQH